MTWETNACSDRRDGNEDFKPRRVRERIV